MALEKSSSQRSQIKSQHMKKVTFVIFKDCDLIFIVFEESVMTDEQTDLKL